MCCDGAVLCALVTMIMLKDSKQDQEKLCSLGPPAARCKLLHPPGLPVSIFSLSLSLSLSLLSDLSDLSVDTKLVATQNRGKRDQQTKVLFKA